MLGYCICTSVFIVTYAFTGHTFVSNLMALGHNHWEIQLIAIALLRPEVRVHCVLPLLHPRGLVAHSRGHACVS